MHTQIYPFAAIVGQETLKLALVLNAVNPAVGGVLVRGEKGTAKSTSVRALAALLPEIEVFAGCGYHCGPDEPQLPCDQCRICAGPQDVVRRRVRVVTLPLNATEDRVVGGIDFDKAVRSGRRVMQPGLLARVHRGILYVDEVNLLDDHLVDVILDASGAGVNRIEREGISFAHPARFVLTGTMNPEEGELRPQLLDRFGLCVEVAAESDPDRRMETMERREAYDNDPEGFSRIYALQNKAIAKRIETGRRLMRGGIDVPGRLRPLIAELCTENNVAGHRADLVIEQAAMALAAYEGRREVTVEEILKVAPLALLHRRREAAPPPPPPDHDHNDNQDRDQNQDRDRDQDQNRPEENDQPTEESSSDEAPPPGETGEGQADSQQGDQSEQHEPPSQQSGFEEIFDVGRTFKVKKFSAPKDRLFRRGSGRRSRTRAAQTQGRYVKSTLDRSRKDVALDATLRAAAPYQLDRKNGNGLAVVLKPEDIREKIREKRIGNFLLFVVDASGSMGARGRMVASKGAIMSLLLDAYQKRDRVAMVSFRRDEAVLNLPPTASIELAANLLKEMPVGGRTPLSAGLAKSYEVLRNYTLREPTARPIAIIITDGRSNMALGERKPLEEALILADRLAAEERFRFIVVDTESEGLISFGLAGKLAAAMNARYFKIEELQADSLLNIVKGEM